MSFNTEPGSLPNTRGGFHHIHLGKTECGIAYVLSRHPIQWAPCSKLVNHEGPCGYADNTCF